MPTTLNNEAAICGIGDTEFSKNSGRSELSLAAEATRELTKRTGKKLGVDPDAWRKWLEETFR